MNGITKKEGGKSVVVFFVSIGRSSRERRRRRRSKQEIQFLHFFNFVAVLSCCLVDNLVKSTKYHRAPVVVKRYLIEEGRLTYSKNL